MSKNSVLRWAACLAIVLVVAGCPLAGSMIAGAWVLTLDDGCDQMNTATVLLALYGNGNAELYASNVDTGTWALSGSTLVITFPNINGDALILTGTVANGQVNVGNYTVNQSAGGCWSAEKLPN